MRFGPVLPVAGVAIRDRLSQTLQPGTRPCEFDAQYRQADRNDDQGRAGRNEHDETNQDDGRSNDTDDNPPGRLVSQMERSSYHLSCRSLGLMKPILVCILALIVVLIVPSTPSARADGDLVLAAPETEVLVEPRASHLRLVNLPELEFAVRAAYRCQGELVSLTLSVSDSAQTLGPQELTGQRATELSLVVPARQIAMADNGAFCIAGDETSADEIHITGFVTAAASLRCAKDGGESIRYASAPLTVRLSCTRNEDQEPPVSSGDK